MNDDAAVILYAVLLATAVGTGIRALAGRRVDGRRRIPVATITALVVVGVPTLLQFTIAPSLLADLERDPAAIGHGQLWRLFTSLVVQDGGLVGAAGNLIGLAVVGIVAERIWGSMRWSLVAISSGVAAQVWGLVVQPVGAGNSVAVFGLAASVAVLGLSSRDRFTRVLAMLSLAVAVVLLVSGDIHGGAAAVGAALGLGLSRVGGTQYHPVQANTVPGTTEEP